jgi:hypothetical protein
VGPASLVKADPANLLEIKGARVGEASRRRRRSWRVSAPGRGRIVRGNEVIRQKTPKTREKLHYYAGSARFCAALVLANWRQRK